MAIEIEARAAKVDVVLRDFVAEKPAGSRVVVAGHAQTACKIAQTRRDDEDDVVLALTPGNTADFAIRDKRRVRPNPVLVEAARDVAAQRKQVRVIEEHHGLAED